MSQIILFVSQIMYTIYMNICDVCRQEFQSRRQDAKYCSAKCRKIASRGEKLEEVHNTMVDEPTFKRHNDEIMNKILKEMHLPPLMSDEERKVRWISSGVDEIDELIESNNTTGWKGGGFPTKRVIEVYGRRGIGKTTLMAKMLPKMGGKVLYIDAENALFGEGSIPENVTVICEPTLEIVEGIVSRALDSNYYDVIVVDSVAALVCQTEVDGDSGQAHIGLKARLMHQWMRRVTPHLRDSDTALVFINQERISIGMFATKYTPGGTALDYAASIRVELISNSKDKIIKDKQQIGHWINVKLEKNRFGPTGAMSKFKAIYDNPIVPNDDKLPGDIMVQEEIDEIEHQRRVVEGEPEW